MLSQAMDFKGDFQRGKEKIIHVLLSVPFVSSSDSVSGVAWSSQASRAAHEKKEE